MKTAISFFPRLVAFVGLILFCTVSPYVLGYIFVQSNPELLREVSYSTSQMPSSLSEGTSESVGVGSSVETVVTRWSWLRGVHEKFISLEMLLFLSLGLCLYFKPPSKEKHPFMKKAFFTYGIFTALWFSSLAFSTPHKFDEILIVLLLLSGVFLLGASTMASLRQIWSSKKKVKNLRQSIHKWGFLFGVFMAIWLVSITFIPFGFIIPLIAFGLAGLSVAYCVFTVLFSQIREED